MRDHHHQLKAYIAEVHPTDLAGKVQQSCSDIWDVMISIEKGCLAGCYDCSLSDRATSGPESLRTTWATFTVMKVPILAPAAIGFFF